MAYDVFYYGSDGRRLNDMDRATPEYDTPRRNKMLRELREYAEAIQIDHPHRPAHHWNGKRWVEGHFPGPHA